MQGDGKKRLWTLPLLLGAGLMASAVAEENAERSKEGFIEGSEVNLLLRNFYFNRDFRKGQSSPAGGGYTEEWVQGFMANFSSGFTQGTLGVGIDAFAQLGVRLDAAAGVPAPAVASTCCPMTTRGGRRTTIREPAARSSCAGMAPCCGSATCSRKPR